ncbi:MAG: cupin domain-containing protein [Pseudomonadota bacterium]
MKAIIGLGLGAVLGGAMVLGFEQLRVSGAALALSPTAAKSEPANPGGVQREALAKPKASLEKLLSTTKTVLDQPITYPNDGDAKITAVIVTMPPGAETGWHFHEVPLFGYMLEGELTVTYKGHGQRVYRTGDSLMEAMWTPHDGQNLGDKPVRILAVFMGGGGLKNSVKLGPGVE